MLQRTKPFLDSKEDTLYVMIVTCGSASNGGEKPTRKEGESVLQMTMY